MSASGLQRRQSILSQMYEQGHWTVKDLSTALAVSEATIRRDLRSLAGEGQVQLTHGGAFISRGPDYSLRSKATRNVEAKKRIGALASSLIADGEQIFIDSGTTCFEMVAHLRAKRRLSVIVNSVRVAQELDAPGMSVILLGGQYRPDRMDTIGPVATSTLDQLRGYVAFIGCDGLGLDFGPTAVDIDSAHLYRLAVQNSRQTILLADQSKFATPSLYKIVDWSAISRVITDAKPQSLWCEFFEARGISVLFPDPKMPAEIAASAGSDSDNKE